MMQCELGVFSQKADNECDQCKPSVCGPYPTCKTLSTSAYCAKREYVSKSQNWLVIMSLFPRLQRGVSFRIMKFWGDEDRFKEL